MSGGWETLETGKGRVRQPCPSHPQWFSGQAFADPGPLPSTRSELGTQRDDRRARPAVLCWLPDWRARADRKQPDSRGFGPSVRGQCMQLRLQAPEAGSERLEEGEGRRPPRRGPCSGRDLGMGWVRPADCSPGPGWWGWGQERGWLLPGPAREDVLTHLPARSCMPDGLEPRAA